MKYLALSFFLLLGACGSAKKYEGYKCRATNLIIDTEAASKTLLVCTENRGLKTFDARCDFTVDPIEYGRPYLVPKAMTWTYKDKIEGVNFSYDEKGQGFVACEKLKR